MIKIILALQFLLQAHAQSSPEIQPPTAEEAAVEDANSPVPVKKDEVISAFDEEEGMIVKKLTSPFDYDRTSRRDPFRLPEISGVEIPLGAYFGPFLDLQEIPLDEIKIKALILDPIRPKAIISFMDHDNKPVNRKVFVGDYIGENYGIIQSIREGQIIIVQTFVEGDKKLTTTKTLNIRK
jgi:Tfp pilus assembly protein PilP